MAMADSSPPLHSLTATAVAARLRDGTLTAEQYAQALLDRINQRDNQIHAWAYIDPIQVIEQARALDKVPVSERGPMHGLPVGIKDVIYTKDMPTGHNSSIYKDSFPKVDAASIAILRQAGALIFGKTTTTEFAATTIGPLTQNPNSLIPRTPGGSSSGSGAAVADLQIPLALATQTGGSTIRPASFNGIYGLKPTWNSVSREGQKLYSLLLDTLGWYGREVADLELLADVFGVKDDEPNPTFNGIKGAKIGLCKSPVWNKAGKGTVDAINKAADLLRKHGALVEEVDLPSEFSSMAEWHRTLLGTDGQVTFLPEYRTAKDKLHESLSVFVTNPEFSHKQQLAAQDGIAALRPKIDEIAGRYDAILTPSVPDEAPEGLGFTGDAAFCGMWTALHVPVINIPGFQGANGMPIGVSLLAPRFRDRYLLKVAEPVGKIFEAEGGWTRQLA